MIKTGIHKTSPQWQARMAGALYLAVIALGIFAEGFVINHLLVSGDAALSAQNIIASATLWNLGIFANLMLVVCVIPLSWFLYLLLRPVDKNLVLLAVFFNLISVSVETLSKMFLLFVLPLLTNAGLVKAFEPAQLHAFASLALRAHNFAFNIALILFGCTCIIYGYLIFKSGYFPKFIGVLMQVAGASYVINCFSVLFVPAISNLISPAILLLPFIGEAAFCLWLLVKGVDIAKWNARYSAAPAHFPQS
ncbi:hypothetical protein RCH09_002636 [Actimicrobium sp. GrIS 1.19]|uniref:DUF4386 domain-containing protein n=1 Tax=Actimicrobium sp. GrIS 1.19 TaxID=3071708 RepID=UPI002E0431C3|nr:hypothetical protein [Actimicrobium sp. GrIS 1.19]